MSGAAREQLYSVEQIAAGYRLVPGGSMTRSEALALIRDLEERGRADVVEIDDEKEGCDG